MLASGENPLRKNTKFSCLYINLYRILPGENPGTRESKKATF